ncbi:hypothetical protein MKW98_026439 [Papaver atlanticum]|uniref:PGG domain-containing protein n=1 Tax=Papaver atlanticum TaxID=357466 RepID=A0AAD4XSF9_9MAGN|nr:hypothetical protein MKW98_026439 [Papaver atlanticum]
MSSATGESSDNRNHQSHEEIIEMKSLFKMLVESQNKQAESLAKLAETQAEALAKLADTQANTQQQIIEILKNSNIDNNNTDKQQDIAGSSGVDKQEIADIPADNDEKEPELEGGYESTVIPGKHDLLYEAIKNDDVETAIDYIKNNPEAIEEGIDSYDKSTALHETLYRGQKTIVEEIIKLVSTPRFLEYKRSTSGDTALHVAAFRGNVEAAMMMVAKNSKLTQIRNDYRKTALEDALGYVSAGQKEMVKYLYSVTRHEEPSPFLGHDGARLLCSAIAADFYDLVLCLVKRFPKLITVKSENHDACGLELLVRKPYAFGIGTKLTWWQDRVYSLIQVDINATYVQLVETNTCQSSEISERDEDNIPESSEDTNKEESSNGKSDKNIFMPYSGRVFGITKLYNLKLMHKHATATLKQMIVELRDAKSGDEITDFFKNNPDIMKLAIKHGIIVFVAECLEHFGHLIWHYMSGQTMLDMAIIERNVTIVSLICDRGDKYKDKTSLVSKADNDEKNTILHYAAKLASPAQLNLISGVALQIQRELQWLKGVESIMPENDKFKKNKEGYTAEIVFTNEHKELLKEGEDWMKDTSGSCMIVAALIATVAFAAAFTVPGGNISDKDSPKNGTPVFLGQPSFTLFAVADALALFSSITSVLMFLAIYTSRYSEKDFLRSLPQKIIIGLTALFISMAAILIAFCASLFIVVGNEFPRGVIPIALFGSVPVVLFAWLQLPLFYEMVRSTYWGSLFREHKYIDPRVEKNNQKENESIVNPVQEVT